MTIDPKDLDDHHRGTLDGAGRHRRRDGHGAQSPTRDDDDHAGDAESTLLTIFFAMALMDKDLRGFQKLAEEVGYEPRVTGAAIRWFREAMAGTLASGDHIEVVKLIGYPEGERS